IAVIGFTIWSTSRQVSGEELYARFYTTYPNSISPLTKGSQESEMDGFQAYELGRYDQAMRLLSEEDSDTARFYLALAELGSFQTENAEVLLTDIGSAPGYYQIPALWYLALVNLKQEEFTEARAHLQQVRNSSHPLSQRADQLISILEQD
ncbi:MAG: tetratricopeptide repeat protein, partial [Saprospiraceae bacterium]|nr:tetratricopeptide repeat protein [Saprospiraceae bacterium]